MMNDTYLLYGAYGYTGQLITRFSEISGLKPILAGRNEEKLKQMSAEFGYDYLAFDLTDNKALYAALDRVAAAPAGPNDQERATAKSMVWGKVSNAAGTMISANFQGPEGYTLTANTSLLIVQKVLNKEVYPGFQTPAGAYGKDLVMEIPGTKRKLI